MAQVSKANNQRIITLSNDQFSALSSFLYELRDQPEKLRQMNHQHTLGLGSNHIESLTQLWADMNSVS